MWVHWDGPFRGGGFREGYFRWLCRVLNLDLGFRGGEGEPKVAAVVGEVEKESAG